MDGFAREAFGIDPLDRVSPPPPREPTPPPPDPFEPASLESATEHPGFFVLLLRLCALVMDAHRGTRESIARECEWVLAFAEKLGRPPNDDEGAGTWVSMCLNALRAPTPAPEPPQPEGQPEDGGGEGDGSGEGVPDDKENGGGKGANGGAKGKAVGGGAKGKGKGNDKDSGAGEAEGEEQTAPAVVETEEEKAARLEREAAQRVAQQALHDEDIVWHNGGGRDVYSTPRAVCRSRLFEA